MHKVLYDDLIYIYYMHNPTQLELDWRTAEGIYIKFGRSSFISFLSISIKDFLTVFYGILEVLKCVSALLGFLKITFTIQ